VKRWIMLAITLAVLVAGLAVLQSGKVGLPERYIILIVLGVVLLAVSFLYKKDREKVS
jgi:hypothetical protein